ncbi:hypothetical protein [Sagittula sp. S175]|uniref:hypothetical protein n=1 Tax=Sagittula sp. S175 TaxID=3415129 RepID=UPI003C7E4053
MRHVFAVAICLGVWGGTQAMADCATYQRAYRVAPPASGVSEDQGGPLGCSTEALEMFEINKVALAEARPVADIRDLHGAWLGDAVLAQVSFIEVPGQELLVFAPGDGPNTVEVTQYWMKAASFGRVPNWSVDGEYTGIVARTVLEKQGRRYVAPEEGTGVEYGGATLEFSRGADLHVKARINHFDMPLAFGLAGDVLVLEGTVRDPVTREEQPYARSYTRIDAGAAKTALGLVMAFEQSQTVHFDCVAHQLSDGAGPFVDAMGQGMEGLAAFVADQVGQSVRIAGLKVSAEAGDVAAREALQAAMEGRIAQYSDPAYQEQVERILAAFGEACPPL